MAAGRTPEQQRLLDARRGTAGGNSGVSSANSINSGGLIGTNTAQQQGFGGWLNSFAPQSSAPTSDYDYFNQAYDTQQQGFADNRNYLNTIGSLNGNLTGQNQQQMDAINRQLDWQDQQDVGYFNQSIGLANQLGGYRDTANAADQANYNRLSGTLQSGISSNNAALGNYTGLYNQLSAPLSSGVSWQGDLTSQAAQAYADPASIAAQNQALGQLQGAASGSLDNVSRAAQAYADPRAINGQMAMADQLALLGTSMKDINPSTLQGFTELQGAMAGSLDLKPGEIDPAAYAALVDARNKYLAGTNPEVTAQERFIYEQARLNQERDEQATRAAVGSQARQRGLSGTADATVRAALAGQQTSQNRLLSDLGAQANAIARAEQNKAGYADVSSNMNAQANALGVGNMDRRFAANQSVTGIAKDVAEFNQQRQVNASNAAAGVYSTARGQSFNEAFNRGVAADNMANANSDRRLSAMGQSGQLASNMRSQSFNEAYSRGQAADSTAQFNRVQSIGVDQFNAQFNQQERNSQWARGTDLVNQTQNINSNNAIMAQNDWTAGQANTAGQYGRNQDVIGAYDTANTRLNNATHTATGNRIGAAGTQIGLNNDAYGRDIGLVGGYQQNSTAQTNSKVNYLQTQAGLASNRAAGAAAVGSQVAPNQINFSRPTTTPPIVAKQPNAAAAYADSRGFGTWGNENLSSW